MLARRDDEARGTLDASSTIQRLRRMTYQSTAAAIAFFLVANIRHPGSRRRIVPLAYAIRATSAQGLGFSPQTSRNPRIQGGAVKREIYLAAADGEGQYTAACRRGSFGFCLPLT